MAAEILVKFVGDAKGFSRAADKVSNKLGKIGIAGAAAVAAVAAAGAGIALSSISAFGDFDQAMTQSLAIMGDVSDAMRNEMAQAARDVATSTTFSAEQAAESYFFLASAGLDAEQALAALPQVANFAQAGMFDMALATDLLTDAQSALGLSVDDAAENLDNMQRVADVLVGANTLANASVEQFSSALTNRAGPAMRSVGMDLEAGVAVLAAFADQGIKGEVAGTQFGIVMRDLQTKALANADAFSDLGIAVFDSEGEFRNMADIIGDVEGALEGLSDAEQKETLLNLGFSDKSVSALQTLLGTSDQIREYEEALRGAGGTTDEIANNQLQSFNAQMDLLKSRAEDLKIEIGSKLAPLVLKFFDELGAFWAQHGETIIAGLKRFGEIASAAFTTVTDWWNSDGESTFISIGTGISNAFNAINEWWDENGEAIVDAIVSTLTSMGEDLASLWPQVQEMFQSAFDFIVAQAEFFAMVFGGIWDLFGENIINIFVALWDFVIEFLGGIFEAIGGIFEIFAGLFSGDWGRMWDGLLQVLKGLWDAVFALVRGALRIIWEILKAGWTAVSGLFGLVWDWAKEKWDEGWNKFKNGLNVIIDFITGLASDVFNAAVDLGSSVIDGFKDGISGLVGAAGDFASAIVNKVKSLINRNVIDKINDALEFTIPLPFGGSFTINPPDIPRLARGGFATSPTLAIVGDTPGEGEIVSPESKMREIVSEEAGGAGVNIENFNVTTNASPDMIAKSLSFEFRARRM